MTLEKDILQTAKAAIEKALLAELVGYNKPLNKLTERVISSNESELFRLINDEFCLLLHIQEFKEALQKALNEKLAKVLISRMGGELEKTSKSTPIESHN